MATTLPEQRRRAGLGGVARGGVLNLAGAAVSGSAGLLVTALVARGLGRTAAGVFFAATSAFLLAEMLARLGTSTGLVYWLARLRTAGRHDLLHRCLRVALVPAMLVAVAAALALAFGAPRLARLPVLAAGGAGQAAGFTEAVRVLALFLPVAVCSDVLLAATRGYRTMRPTALVDRVARPALQLLLLTVGLLVASSTVDVFAWAAPYAASAALAAWWLARVDRDGRRPVAVTGDETSVPARLGTAFWRFTAPRAVASVAQVALQRLDVLLVAALLGFPAAAGYTVATRFLVLGQLGNQAIGSAVQPRLAELLTRRDTTGVATLYQSSTAWVVLLTWPVFVLVGVFAPVYLRLFGDRYAGAGAVAVVVLLCLAMLVASGCGMVDMMLTMGGRTSWNLANVAVAFGVNLTLDLLLVRPLGIAGAALGWAAALLVKNLLPLTQIRLSLRLHPFGAATRTAAALVLVAVGLPALAARALLGAGPAGIAVTLAVTVPAYLAGCRLLRDRLGLTGSGLGRRAGAAIDALTRRCAPTSR